MFKTCRFSRFILSVTLIIIACLINVVRVDAKIVKVDELDHQYTQGNKITILKNPNVKKFEITTNIESNRFSLYSKPAHSNYVRDGNWKAFITEGHYKTKNYDTFQEEYGAKSFEIKNPKPTDIINIYYGNIGFYENKAIDLKIQISNINYSVRPGLPDNGVVYFDVSESPYSGYAYYNASHAYIEYSFFYSDTGQAVNVNGNSFLTFNSLNGYGPGNGEFINYLNYDTSDENSLVDAYLKKETNVSLQSFDNNPYFSYKNPIYIGLNNNFEDKLGSDTFTRNSVSFQILGVKHKFVFGAGHHSAWNAVSSSTLFSVTAPTPTKNVKNTSGEDINGKDVYFNQEIIYNIGQKVNILGQDILEKYKSFEIRDRLSPYVEYKNAMLISEDGNVIENAGSITYDKSTHTVRFVANEDFLKNRMQYNGETYFLRIYTKVLSVKDFNYVDGIQIENKGTSIINSISKDSNIVRNNIKPMLAEIGVKKIQIYTDRHDLGLPIYITLDPSFLGAKNQNELKDKNIVLKVIDKSTNQLVLSKKYDLSEIPSFIIQDKIPGQFLKTNSKSTYEATISTEEPKFISITDPTINTEGYTATEENISVKESKSLSYKAVVMTERVIHQDMKKYYETINFENTSLPKQKTGYGFAIDFDIEYTNDLGKIDDIAINAIVNDKLVDSYLDYDSKLGYTTIPLELLSAKISDKESTFNFKLPHVNVEEKTGYLFTDKQVQENDKRIKHDLFDGKRKLYVPIWADLDKYDIYIQPKNTIGINRVKFSAEKTLDVYAYMYGHIGSDTIDKDEIIIEPVDPQNPFPEGLPEGWTQNDLNWLKRE